VVAPFDSEDARGLLKSSIRDDAPVVFLESEVLYTAPFPVSAAAASPDFLIPLGQAKVMTVGSDVTIISYSRAVGKCIDAAKELATKGVSAEVINLRTIRPLDRDTIIASVKKTGRLVTVEEGWPQSGVGAELIAQVNEAIFDYLDAPPLRIAVADVPMPYSWVLETAATPQVDNIVSAVLDVCSRPFKS